MNINKFIYTVLTTTLLFIGSCQKVEDQPGEIKSISKEEVTNILDLSSEDAARVAKKFYSDKVATRADTEICVKNVVPITDETGEPAIYAVNLQDGYLLISATKSYYPILAQVDHGTFSPNDKEITGQDVVIQEYLDDIKAAKDSLYKFDCKHLWFPYEEKIIPERVMTRAYDDFYAMQDVWFQKWYDEQCETYYLNRKPDDLPDEIYERFCTTATELDPWEDTEYNCMNFVAVVTEKTYDLSRRQGPFVYANWAQGSPYNSDVSGGYPLGCVTVAVGQLMRYYEHPGYFGWSDMPYSGGSSTTLSAFLAELRKKLDVTNDGSSNINKAKSVLESYGYNCNKGTHSADAVYAALQKNMPVYTRGEDKDGNGHAWVIDGSNAVTTYTEYKLYILNDCAYPQFEYIEVDSWRNYHVQNVFFHMNWGWGGRYNGWFLDSRIGFNSQDGEKINYYRDRKDLIITGHK